MTNETAQWVEVMSAATTEFRAAVREMDAWFRNKTDEKDSAVRAARAKWFAQEAAKQVAAVFPDAVNWSAFDAVFAAAKEADRDATVRTFRRAFTAPTSVQFA